VSVAPTLGQFRHLGGTGAIALIIFAGLLGLATAISGIGKLRGMPQVMAMLHHVGLDDGQIRLLGLVELAGALGLLLGIWVPILGVLAAAGFTIYFIGAVIAHARVKDAFKDMAPAVLLAVIAIITLFLQVAR
jgi:uncharacterized membrane protein YphA (DoxX/SURF4 family)